MRESLTGFGSPRMFDGVLRSVYSWLLLALGPGVCVLGGWLLSRSGDPTPERHDFAGPIDLSPGEAKLIAIGVIVVGCAMLAFGVLLRRRRISR